MAYLPVGTSPLNVGLLNRLRLQASQAVAPPVPGGVAPNNSGDWWNQFGTGNGASAQDASASNNTGAGGIGGFLNSNPNLLLGIGAGLMDKRQNNNVTMSSVFQNALSAGQVDQQTKTKNLTRGWLKSKYKMSDQEAEAMSSNPALLSMAIKNKPQFTKIGEDQLGQAIYGWVDPDTQEVTPIKSSTSTDAPGGANGVAGALYQGLDVPKKGIVDAMIAGRMPLPSSFALKTPYWQNLIAAAHDKLQASGDPVGFDATIWGSRLKTRQEFSAGGPNTPAGSITAGRTAIQHLGKLAETVKGLGNWKGIPFVSYYSNKAKNAAAIGTGTEQSKALTNFNGIRNKFVEEATKFYRGVGGNEADLERDIAVLDAAKSPEELYAGIDSMTELMMSKVNALQDRWKYVMGEDNPFPIIDPTTQEAIDKIKEFNNPYAAGDLYDKYDLER